MAEIDFSEQVKVFAYIDYWFYRKVFIMSLADRKLQSMDADLFHFISFDCRIFCAEHVRGCRGWELPQMQRGTWDAGEN